MKLKNEIILKKIEKMNRIYLIPTLFLVIMACSINRSSDISSNDNQVNVDLQKKKLKIH